ncbi:MAG TPA: DUF4279 domain-containing protein [Clostridia bacterium]|nr:DUF4279 domain-containing protein [Clostridia bacterium]
MHSEISCRLGVLPTEEHKKGDAMDAQFPFLSGRKFSYDVWLLTAPIASDKPLADHIRWICCLLEPHLGWIVQLIEKGAIVEISCSCTLRDNMSQFAIPSEYVRLASQAPVGISFLVMRGASLLK